MAFNFKQFSVQDEHSAMKVGIDAVVLATNVSILPKAKVLDLGAGTGIVSLILAQRFPEVLIHAIEIDEKAFIDLQENFRNAPWANRLQKINADFISYNFKQNYDVVISNPPFFEANSTSINMQRRTARYQDSINPTIICTKAKSIMTSKASLIVIFPFELRLMFVKEALLQGFMLKSEIFISDTKLSKPKRSILTFANTKVDFIKSSSLFLKNENGGFTKEFMDVTEDLYL